MGKESQEKEGKMDRKVAEKGKRGGKGRDRIIKEKENGKEIIRKGRPGGSGEQEDRRKRR